jgi:two-component system response regulator AtoC
MALILVVDDDRNLCKVLKGLLEKAGYSAVVAFDVHSALPIIDSRDLDLIVTDLKIPGESGMDLLAASRQKKPAVPVIMISGYGNIEDAVRAMKQGAYDFITKPFDENELLNVIEKSLSESKKNRELLSAYFDSWDDSFSGIIGSTREIGAVLAIVRKIADTESTVLITGETGVGKELIARAIHQASRRRSHPLVKVNCAAIPAGLIESELFGYEKGAFTGAVTSKPGRFEIAHESTMFLDEIGEMPLPLQAKLLGVLQDRSFERVGGVKTIKVDARVIAATNKDLQEAVRKGEFRPDLFYRLNVVPVHIPPLRERREDLVPLVEYFAGKFSRKHRKKIAAILPEALEALCRYDWPGNVRELENAIERMVLMSEKDLLGLEELPEEIRGTPQGSAAATLREKVDDAEKQMIVDALDKAGQNRTRAARMLGISRRTLQNKLKEYGL